MTKFRSFKQKPTSSPWLFFIGIIIGVVFTLVFMTQCESLEKIPLFHNTTCTHRDSLEILKGEVRWRQAIILEYEKDSLDFQDMK